MSPWKPNEKLNEQAKNTCNFQLHFQFASELRKLTID